MPYTLKRTKCEYVFDVSEEPPLDVAWNPANGQFLPQLMTVTTEGDDLNVYVVGPELRKGKPLKTKVGFLTWRRHDLYGPEALDDTPEWVLAAVDSVLLAKESD